ncbi:Alg9-like mannosyltransferase family-domain-containing protein [Trichophaea hybrida]|nr:Alg9-like mannosyltransferase family-domain-containing protein [Trichophaea hybrida]
MGIPDFLLPFVVTLTHLLVSPYTKVEESFSLQATHDIIHYGLPTSNVSSYLTEHYDHLTFPGAVPRSFVGPLLLAYASAPFRILFGSWVDEQTIVRGTLALTTSLALGYYIHRIRSSYGATTARVYTLLQLTQFHLPYYASRTLPNTFALTLTLLSNACFLPGGSSSVGIALLTITAIIFRSEVALLFVFHAIHQLLSFRLPLRNLLISSILGGILGLSLTLTIDSYFWLSASPTPHFTTPILSHLSLLWPELTSFHFNALQGQASSWGTQPWHYYLTSSLPKLLLNPISLITLPLAIFTSPTSHLLLPNLAFIFTYSLLPHKEWRFIIYTLPPLTLLSSVGFVWSWNRRTKRTIYLLLSPLLLSSIPLSLTMLLISSQNYPGGVTLSRLPGILPHNATIHLDVKTCMTGASRFLQDKAPGVSWDKTEDSQTLLTPQFWEDMDWVVTEAPERVIGAYEVVDVVRGFKRVRVYRPGEEVVDGGKWGKE